MLKKSSRCYAHRHLETARFAATEHFSLPPSIPLVSIQSFWLLSPPIKPSLNEKPSIEAEQTAMSTKPRCQHRLDRGRGGQIAVAGKFYIDMKAPHVRVSNCSNPHESGTPKECNGQSPSNQSTAAKHKSHLGIYTSCADHGLSVNPISFGHPKKNQRGLRSVFNCRFTRTLVLF